MRTFLRRQRTAAVTLIEVLLAIVVLVFGLLGVANIIDANKRNTHRATGNLQAVELARMKAAEFRAAGGPALGKLVAGEQPVLLPADGPAQFNLDEVDDRFRRQANFRWQATLTRDETAGHIVYRLAVYVGEEDASRAELTGFIDY